MRKIPNPNSTMLANAIVGGAGLGTGPVNPPAGMGVVVLYVPLGEVIGKTLQSIQDDLGLPWHAGDGQGVWFDELDKSA